MRGFFVAMRIMNGTFAITNTVMAALLLAVGSGMWWASAFGAMVCAYAATRPIPKE